MANTLSDAWIESSFERLKNKLGIYGGNSGRAQAWRDTAGTIDPETFYKTLTRDLPGQTSIMIDADSGCSELNLTCKHGTTTLLDAENKMQRRSSQPKISFEEWRVGSKDKTDPSRGLGLGTILFANQLELMEPMGLRYIALRAGREDGPVYWARRGFRIEENGPYLRDFIHAVRESYEATSLEIIPETRRTIESILDNPTYDANIRIAQIEDTELRQQLMAGTNPRCIIDTQDAAQMKMVHESLKNIDAIRQKVRETFPVEAIVTPPPSSGKGFVSMNLDY